MKQLKPNQQKLWRRIYLNAFETGSNVQDSCRMADETILEWEARGAFDDEPTDGGESVGRSGASILANTSTRQAKGSLGVEQLQALLVALESGSAKATINGLDGVVTAWRQTFSTFRAGEPQVTVEVFFSPST